MQSIKLKGKVIITGTMKAVTGLHIGGAAAGLDIGGIDNPILRHPVTREPYIPGSSLRGKLRSLLDRKLGKKINKNIQNKAPFVRIHECDNENEYAECPVCQVFGISPGGDRKDWEKIKPTRLLIRDTALSAASKVRLNKAKLDLPYTEVKWEAIEEASVSRVNTMQENVRGGMGKLAI